MVGVCFWVVSIILMVSSANSSKSRECPVICSCLGTYIDCDSKDLDRIPSTIPSWVTHLDLHGNAIKNLSNVQWKHLSSLTELKLNKNNIASINKDHFIAQRHLKILDLNRNKLRIIDPLSFKNLEFLQILKLKRNQISQLSDGAFYGLANIDKLILDFNHIPSISKSWLYGLDSLKELSLAHNNITHIEFDAWEFCRVLTYLDLSFNQLVSIEADTFKNLGDLQKLFLNNNNITIIKENAFVHLPKLKFLVLNNNKIWWTIEDANGVFRGLNNLAIFHLLGNNIKALNKNAFVGLKNVTQLNLGNNNITSIQKNVFLEMPILNELVINTTSLICDCNIRWLIDWVAARKFKFHAICAYPEELQGKSLFEIPPNNLTCDELPKPRLTEEPDLEIMALKGENVSLNCTAMSSSSSTMTFQWKKDNVEITNSEITVHSSVIDNKTVATSQLNLRWVNNSNAGKYQCVVSNTFGTTYSQKSTISVLVYPTFVKIPKNITVRAGHIARLECAANGEPQPEVAWKKDGGNDFPAARERRMEYMPNDDVFFILNAKESDMGVYSCTAHNAAGTIVANASLIFEEKPSFVKSMEDKEVIAGNVVALQCMASGRPKPSITWMKDGQAITATERHFFTAEDQLMIIVDTMLSDSGRYECHLNNSLGEETGYSTLVVKPSEFREASANNMMGIIIITVVCCAVLTSIIWVVIIYQTRKRPPIPIELKDLDMAEKSLTQQPPNIQLRQFSDNMSDHSSCKDSGTGDSAKRSSDDLVPEDYTMVINEAGEHNNSHVPLLHYPRSTNHDRATIESDLSPIQSVKDL